MEADRPDCIHGFTTEAQASIRMARPIIGTARGGITADFVSEQHVMSHDCQLARARNGGCVARGQRVRLTGL